MLRAMGKLAERYGDAARSGVYRVRDARVPRAAAVEAGALLIEIGATGLAEGWARVEQAIASERTRACVILVPDAASLADADRAALGRVAATAQACRAAGRPFFAVMVDPEGRLALERLYHEGAG